MIDEKEIPLTTYFAVEILSWTTPHQVAEAVIRQAKENGTLFRRLESMGSVEVAGRKFERFRTDLSDTNLDPVLTSLLTKGHGVVGKITDGYEVRFPIRTGRINSTILLSGKAVKTRMYRGPKIKYWERQFEADQKP